MLLANFATPDPVAERKKKREYRQTIQRELLQQARDALRARSAPAAEQRHEPSRPE